MGRRPPQARRRARDRGAPLTRAVHAAKPGLRGDHRTDGIACRCDPYVLLDLNEPARAVVVHRPMPGGSAGRAGSQPQQRQKRRSLMARRGGFPIPVSASTTLAGYGGTVMADSSTESRLGYTQTGGRQPTHGRICHQHPPGPYPDARSSSVSVRFTFRHRAPQRCRTLGWTCQNAQQKAVMAT